MLINDGYTTGSLLDYLYHQKHSKRVGVNLSTKKKKKKKNYEYSSVNNPCRKFSTR